MLNEILNERQKTHGDFEDVAFVSQRLEGIMSYGQDDHTVKQKEAIKCICQKLARIACGDASFPDHWKDIAGYAMLAVEEIPNAETQEAMEEGKKGNVETAIDADDLIRQLNEINSDAVAMPLKDYMEITKLRSENRMLWGNIESMKQTNMALIKKLQELK